MKRFSFALLLALLCACAREGEFVSGPSADDAMPFSLELSVPGLVSTRSTVSGQEGIHAMQLVCFDASGLYVGLGSVAFDALSGTLAGFVPGVTASVHFIANAGLVPDDSWREQSEAELIGGLRCDASGTGIVYWGYHREASSDALALWLSAEPRNTVELLRDRAKITLETPDSTWNHSADPSVEEYIVSARFAVCNGRTSGMLAPFDRASLSFAYDAPLTLPPDALRYEGDASELVPAGEAQFLFEDENTLENHVKVILETGYMRGVPGAMSPLVKYHQVMLMNSGFSLYEIRRNHQYNIILGNLPSSIGYDSFAEALAGSPSNNQTVAVQDIIPQVNSEHCSLTVLGGTTRIFQKDPSGGPLYAEIGFSFMKDGLPDPEMSVSDFSAQWLSNKYVSYPNSTLELRDSAGTPGYYRLRVPLYQPITDDLKSGRILLFESRYGLSRYINIYSITAFDFGASLVETDGTYLLTFSIPEDFPPALFPFKVRIVTDVLKPTPAQNAVMALGVEVHDTQPRYGTDWGYYYTYEVARAGTYTVSMAPAGAVGGTPVLFVDAEYFGMVLY